MSRARVLVVDDERQILRALEMKLTIRPTMNKTIQSTMNTTHTATEKSTDWMPWNLTNLLSLSRKKSIKPSMPIGYPMAAARFASRPIADLPVAG